MSDGVPTRPIRVGFIGCGRHATKMLYPCLRVARMDLIAVCDQDEAAARRNARWFGAEREYTDVESMLDDAKSLLALDAVLICTGPKSHTPLALQCVERGIPVFVEKPPALTLAEAERLALASEAKKVPVMIGTMKRHSLIYRRMKEITSAPEFGAVSVVNAKIGVGWKNCNGYTLLLDAGIHMIDALRFLMGDVTGVTYRRHSSDGSGVSYVILFTFASGAVGSLTVSDRQLWRRFNERVEITGDGQFVVAENMLRLSHFTRSEEIITWEPGFSIPSDENNSLFVGGYAGELQFFADAVRTGGSVHADIKDACAALRLIKEIEPEEAYVKGPVEFTHWQSENRWLKA